MNLLLLVLVHAESDNREITCAKIFERMLLALRHLKFWVE